MVLRLYNTMTHRLEEFTPLEDGRVRMYTCGLTVNDNMHIGHARCYVLWDVLQRYLEYLGYRVEHISNVTDISIDEKILRRLKETGQSFQELIETYTQAYFEDRRLFGIRRAKIHPLATQHVHEMIESIQHLLSKGVAYEAEDGVYFDISKFPDYGRLSGIDPKSLKLGAGGRVTADEYDKEGAGDFALWKKAKPGEPYWYSPWGKGRPGWHVECSAMALKYLGETLDIKGGGEDNIFPHHENEMAQTESLTGKTFVKHWMHVKHVLLNGQKMSKSLGNFLTAREAAEKFGPLLTRFFLISTHYRSQIDFNEKDVLPVRDRLERLREAVTTLGSYTQRLSQKQRAEERLLKTLKETRAQFEESMDDDLNISLAITKMLDLAKEVSRYMEKSDHVSGETASQLFEFFSQAGTILLGDLFAEEILREPDIITSRLIEFILSQREEARKSGDFTNADKIRSKLKGMGIDVQDTSAGPVWKLVS